MNRKYLSHIAVCFLVLFSNGVFAQINTFYRTYNLSGMQGGLSTLNMPDGGFVGTGQHQDNGAAGDCDIYVYRVDACGNILWMKLIGTAAQEGAKNISRRSNGNFLLTGIYSPYGFLMELDQSGNIVWEKSLGLDISLASAEDINGDIYVTSENQGANGFYLTKTDGAGNFIWGRQVDDVGYMPLSVIAEGGHVFVVSTFASGGISFDFAITKFDLQGNLVWSNLYSGQGFSNADFNNYGSKAIFDASDNSIVVVNQTAMLGTDDILLSKVRASDGTTIWAKVFGGIYSEQPRDVVLTDAGIAILGNSNSFSSNDPAFLEPMDERDVLLLNLDHNGNILWTKTYGGSGRDKGIGLRYNQGTGFLISAYTSSAVFSGNYFDPLFIKTDTLGFVSCQSSSPILSQTSVNLSESLGGTSSSVNVSFSNLSSIINDFTPNDYFVCLSCDTDPIFTPSDTIVCVGDTVKFINTTTYGLTCFQEWNVNGTTWNGGLDTLSYVFESPGVYPIYLYSNCGAQTDTFVVNIQVDPIPITSFTANSNCVNQQVDFQNQTSIASGSVISYQWNLGGGATSNAFNPSFTYSSPGVVNVSLSATSNLGCASDTVIPVTIYDLPMAQIQPLIGCQGDTLTLIDITTISGGPIVSWLWQPYPNTPWQPGASTFSTSYPGPNTYIASMIVEDIHGCLDTASTSVLINPTPVSNFTSNSACEGFTTTFNNSSSITPNSSMTYYWDFGDSNGTSTAAQPTYLYSSPGVYPVNLQVISNQGCDADTTIGVTVYQNPTPMLATVPEGCAPYQVTFSDASLSSGSPIVSWNWGFGFGQTGTGANPTATFPSSGIFPVYLEITDANGCKADSFFQAWVTANPVPVAQFQTDTVCAGTPVTLNDASASLGGAITSWSWQEANGGIWQPGGPVFTTTYPIAGSYVASLIITDINGCSDTTSRTVLVEPNPVADFSFNNVCLGSPATFTNTTTLASSSSVSYSWDFGDNSQPSTDVQPTHLYSAPGTYTVTLVANTALGCTGSQTASLTVYDKPTPLVATVSEGCVPYQVTFSDASLSSGSPIVSWNWGFGFGQTGTGINPTAIFNNSGIFPVYLEITDANGCKADSFFQAWVTVNPLPVAQFQTDTVCAGLPITFNDASYSLGGAITSWSWQSNTGGVWQPGGPGFTTNYPLAGSYVASLNVTDINGCSSGTSRNVVVEPNPVASFVTDTVCVGLPTHFTNGSNITPTAVLSFEWDFGDGSPISLLSSPDHIYPLSGNYTATIFAESPFGCRDSSTRPVLVYGNPTPDVLPVADGCAPYEVSFLDASVVADAPINSWQWDFGNGSTASLQNPIVIYDASGVFSVTLTVTDANGCQGDSLFQSLVTVHPTPEAGFYFDPASPSVFLSSIYFYNTSTNADTYVWDFGDGVFSIEENPYHVYDSTGIYLIELAVQNIFGCVDTLRQTMEVRDDYAFWTPNAFSPNGDGINEVFLPRGFNISNYSMSIYNRWGQRVFTTEKLEEGWDGKVDGIESKQDVYVFTIRFKDLFNKERSITGRVSLVR